MGVGSSINRVDAWEKVTGQAKYTADLMPQNLYTAKVVHSTIANGWVKSFDAEDALKGTGSGEDRHLLRCAGYSVSHTGAPLVRGKGTSGY